MMENSSLIEDNKIKHIRNLFGRNKVGKKNDATFKGIRNLLRLEKENKAIKDRIIRDIRNLVRLDKEKKAIKYS